MHTVTLCPDEDKELAWCRHLSLRLLIRIKKIIDEGKINKRHCILIHKNFVYDLKQLPSNNTEKFPKTSLLNAGLLVNVGL